METSSRGTRKKTSQPITSMTTNVGTILSNSGRLNRQSEERLSLAISVANDGIWDWDLQTSEVCFSGTGVDISGLGHHPGQCWRNRCMSPPTIVRRKT